MESGGFKASLTDHLEDLRSCFLSIIVIIGIGFLIILSIFEPILNLLTQAINNQKVPIILIGPLEGMSILFKICFWGGFALTSPFWGIVGLKFIFPGLKRQEKQILIPFFALSLIFMGLGIFLAYQYTLPIANQFLMDFNAFFGENLWSLTHYVDYLFLLLMGHAVAGEVVLVLFLMVHTRFLSETWLIEKRRHMIVLAFILGALLTPPDILTQLLMAIPLIALYEVSILYAKIRSFLAKKILLKAGCLEQDL